MAKRGFKFVRGLVIEMDDLSAHGALEVQVVGAALTDPLIRIVPRSDIGDFAHRALVNKAGDQAVDGALSLAVGAKDFT